MAGVALQLDMMERTLDCESRSADSLATQIESCRRFVGRASALLTSLLDVSQIGAGKLNLDRALVDLGTLVTRVLDRKRVELERAGCELRLEVQPGVIGRWDHSRLDQVVSNLVANAIRFGRAKPIEVSVERQEGVGVLEVRDHGIGISAADQERIFGQFERALADGGGVGLGLWIVRKFVGAMGGRITVVSTPGAGATFTMRLPLRPECGSDART